MAKNLKKIIISLLENNSLSKKEIFELIQHQIPDVIISSITWQLHSLKKEGLIQSISRGSYSRITKKSFKPIIAPTLKRIYNKVSKEFPSVQICVWDSRWFNDIMVSPCEQYYLVLEVEKDSVEMIFDSMTDISKKVFLNPTEEIFKRYVSNFNEAYIVKSLITESPVSYYDKIKIASLEKLLVDCISDRDLFSSQQVELNSIFQKITNEYAINEGRLKRYARRRNQIERVEHLLNQNTKLTSDK